MAKHTYTIKESAVSRERITYFIYVISSITSGLLYQIPCFSEYPFLYAIFSVVGIYQLISYCFNNHLWHLDFISRKIGISDLTGSYQVKGQTKDNNGKVTRDWNADINIQQSWDKINIFLKTSQSSSHSKIAELTCLGDVGYKLVYYYVNDPKVGEEGLQKHSGVAELHFNQDLTFSSGDYFNKGRNTFGQMDLIREIK